MKADGIVEVGEEGGWEVAEGGSDAFEADGANSFCLGLGVAGESGVVGVKSPVVV